MDLISMNKGICYLNNNNNNNHHHHMDLIHIDKEIFCLKIK